MSTHLIYAVGVGRGIAPLPEGKLKPAIMKRIDLIVGLNKRRVEALTTRNKRIRRRLLKQVAKDYKANHMPTMAEETLQKI